MQVKVAVHEGTVTLTGTAKDLDEKEAAEKVVRRVPGVRAVENQIKLVEPGAPAPGASVIPEVPAPKQ
jgi:osmotically-inducible protein OsmY